MSNSVKELTRFSGLRVLVLHGWKDVRCPRTRHYPFTLLTSNASVYDFFPHLRLTVLDYETPTTLVQRLLRLTKQTLKAVAIYRRYDLVFTDAISCVLPLAFAHSLLHRSSGPKFVAIDISTTRVPNLIRLIKAAVESIDAIICHTTAQKNWWVRNVGYEATFIHLGWGFTNIEGPLDPDDNRLAVDVETYSKASDSGYIFNGGFVARDYGTLLRATSGLSNQIVLVVGRDFLTDRTGLENVTLSKQVKVHFHEPESSFLELMSKARMVALTMHDKPYAAGQLVLLEAMAMGKPIIVTRTVGTVDYVEDGKTALLVEPYNVSQLKEKLLLVSKDLSLRSNLGRNAKTKWQREFTNSAMLRKIYEVIEDVLSYKDGS